MVEPPRNEWSVVAGTFRARRGRADVGDLLQAAATPRGAFRRPPEGRAHKRPSIRMRGIPPRAPRLRAPLSALDVCRIRPRADAAHLDACGRADHSFLGGSTTSVSVMLAERGGGVLFRDEREEAPALGARSAPNRPSFATVTATRPLDARPRTAAKPSANSRPSAPTRRPPAGSARASNFAQSACPSNSPARITSDSGTSGAMAGADSLGSPGGSPFRRPCATECVAVPPLRAGRCRRLAQAGTGGC